MKKKEILIIFVLAVLTTAATWFFQIHSDHCWSGGYPLKFWYQCYEGPLILEPLIIPSQEVRWSLSSLILDLLFWVLVWGIVWWAVKRFLRLQKAELVIRGLILAGGIVCLLSFLLPWSAPYARTPILFRFFKDLFTGFPRGVGESLLYFVFTPQWILALIVIKGAYSGFSKPTYWISLVLSVLISIWASAIEWIIQMMAFAFLIILPIEEPITHLAGYYAAIIGPIITLVGLILYKLVKKK